VPPRHARRLTDSDSGVVMIVVVVVVCSIGLGPEQELTRPTHPLAIFCNQVFFDYDPSSSTSLLSSVGVTTRP